MEGGEREMSVPLLYFWSHFRIRETRGRREIDAGLAMATFFLEQFGCRATQADAAAIGRQLIERGYAASADANTADVIVVNTCTVTAAADLQARQSIRTIHRENPGARVIVTGCYAQRAPEEIAALEGVSWVVGNSHKPEIPRIIHEMSQEIGQEMAPVPFSVARQEFVPLS